MTLIKTRRYFKKHRVPFGFGVFLLFSRKRFIWYNNQYKHKTMKNISIIGRDLVFLYSVQAKLGLEGFRSEVLGFVDDEVDMIHLLKQKSPDCLVVEISPSYPDELKIIRRARQEDTFSGLPFFAFSDLPGQDFKDTVVNSGIDYYFLKDETNLESFMISFSKILQNNYNL